MTAAHQKKKRQNVSELPLNVNETEIHLSHKTLETVPQYYAL